VVNVLPVSKRIRLPSVRDPTPLVFAILCEQPEIVSYFLARKNARLDLDVDGFFPIHYACLVGIPAIVRAFLDASAAELTRPNSFGYSPLHIAAANQHLQVVLMLLKLGAPVSRVAQNQNTPLHVAMRNDDTKIAECLIAVDDHLLTARNVQNESPLDIATRFGNELMVEFLQRILTFKAAVPLFEVLYLRYVEEEKARASEEVIDMLCKKVQSIMFAPVEQSRTIDNTSARALRDGSLDSGDGQ
jgi:ankyrin repeat protein